MPTVDIDTETITSEPAAPNSRAVVESISKDDLSLRIAKSDGSYQNTWEKLSDFDAEQTFTVGQYTVEAFYGDPEEEGYELPAFAGSCSIAVADGRTTQVALTATPANAMFSIDYSEAFVNYMQGYSAEYVTAKNTIAVAADETRPVYVAPGNVTLNVAATTPTGKSANFKVATVTAQAGYNYCVHVDINGGEAGDATLTVTFDENLATETVEIDLSDELLSTPAPTVNAVGYDPATQIEIVAGFGSDAKPTMNIIAMAGLKSVALHTESASLIAQGWPADVELLNNRDANVVALGLSALGLWQQPDKMAVLDFSDVLSHITANPDSPLTVFTVTVTDALNRVSDPLSLTITTEAPNIVLNKLDCYVPGENLRVSLEFNGSADVIRNNVEFSYIHSVSGMSRKLTVVDVQAASRAMNSYIVTITTPELDEPLQLTASIGGVTSKCTIGFANFAVATTDIDIYATHAYVTVSGTEGNTPDLTAVKFFAKAQSEDSYKEYSATEENGYFNLTGLAAGTTYKLKAQIGTDVCRPINFTTETALQLENGNLDDDATVASSGKNWKNYVFQGWGTNNALTTSQGSDYGYCRKSGTIPTDDSHSGNAVLICNVGWGSGNSAISSDAVASGLFGKGKCKYTEVGLLHLGATRTARPTGYGENDNQTNSTSPGPITTDDLDCGVSFASRPSSLTFWYKYSPKNSADNGLAVVELYDTTGALLGSETMNLASTGEYTQKTVNFSYTPGTPKAAKIYVKFTSSNDIEYVKRTNDNFSGPGFSNLTDGAYLGSQLYIDDIELIY